MQIPHIASFPLDGSVQVSFPPHTLPPLLCFLKQNLSVEL